MTVSKIKKHWFATSAVLALFMTLALAVGFLHKGTALAACAPQDTSRGTATTTVSVPAQGTYRIWSRIQAPDGNNNSYILEIDGTTCGKVVGDSNTIAANSWAWVDYQNGNIADKINVSLSAGTHTVTMIGREDNVKLDRVILTADTTCNPTGTGDDCASPPDTTAPVATITSPNNNGQVTGTQNIAVTATDDTAVTKVEYYVDGTIVNTDTSAPYSYAWDSTKVASGTHSLVAKAYDAAGNVGTSTPVNVTVTNGQPDLVITGISWTPASPDTGNAVTFSATVKNQGTVATPMGTNHGVRFDVDGTQGVSWSGSNTSISIAPGASHTFTADAGPTPGVSTWTATAGSHTITANVDDLGLIAESNDNNNSLSTTMVVNSPDTTAPTVSVSAPANGSTVSGTVTITATAADTGGSNLARVEFYIDGVLKGTDTSSPYNFSWDSNTVNNASHAITAKAFDGAGNSRTSTAINVTVNNTVVVKTGDLNGSGTVDIFDLQILSNNFQKAGVKTRADGDLNNDGVVNVFDLQILSNNWMK